MDAGLAQRSLPEGASLPAAEPAEAAAPLTQELGSTDGPWVPLWLHLGMPLYPDALCALVCRCAWLSSGPAACS